jgi:hypothetical protein
MLGIATYIILFSLVMWLIWAIMKIGEKYEK